MGRGAGGAVRPHGGDCEGAAAVFWLPHSDEQVPLRRKGGAWGVPSPAVEARPRASRPAAKLDWCVATGCEAASPSSSGVCVVCRTSSCYEGECFQHMRNIFLAEMASVAAHTHLSDGGVEQDHTPAI